MLSQMDGFGKNDDIIVVGATNLIDALDKALLRPGRFDRTLKINLPDKNGRSKMFEHYMRKGSFVAET